MTSNLGSEIIRDKMDMFDNMLPEKEEKLLREEIFTLLRKTLKPEFLNRVDEIVMFKPLDRKQIREIVKIQLAGIQHMLSDYQLKLLVQDKAIDWLAEKGYDPQLGARPVKRLIQKEIVNELSKEIIGGNITREDTIIVDVKDGHLTFKKESKGN
jgi:ATP-dependent Clp protease ATP-binding subunit ClpB